MKLQFVGDLVTMTAKLRRGIYEHSRFCLCVCILVCLCVYILRPWCIYHWLSQFPPKPFTDRQTDCYECIILSMRCGVKRTVGPSLYAPRPPTGGDLNSHAELNFQLGGSPLMSVMRVIILHPLTNSEVRRPSQSKDMADFRSRRWSAWWPWPLTFWHVNWVTVHPCHDLPFCQFSALPIAKLLRISHGTDGRTDNGHQCTVPHPMGSGA